MIDASLMDGHAYRILLPETGSAGPLVFASPHSGTDYPDDMGADPGLSAAGLRSAEDALVDRLIACGSAHGAAVITADIGRAYVDLNRGPEELDPGLIEGLDSTRGSARVSAGYGVLARLSGRGDPLYDRILSIKEAQDRIDRVHRPYHQALAALMQAARARHGVAILIDWHSMPSQATGVLKSGTRPLDIVLGDRHGAACSGRLSRKLRSLFEQGGCTVALNRPYAGGYTTQLWGQPGEGYHAMQVELNRGLYLDEATGQPGPGFGRTQALVERVIAGLAAEVWTDL